MANPPFQLNMIKQMTEARWFFLWLFNWCTYAFLHIGNQIKTPCCGQVSMWIWISLTPMNLRKCKMGHKRSPKAPYSEITKRKNTKAGIATSSSAQSAFYSLNGNSIQLIRCDFVLTLQLPQHRGVQWLSVTGSAILQLAPTEGKPFCSWL